MKWSILDVAGAELAEACHNYDLRRAGLGRELLEEARTAYGRIRQLPLAFPVIDQRARRCRVQRFPYNVLYCVFDDEILVVAIAHLRRDPTYWHDGVSVPEES